jgi:hypothetical protein
VEKRQHAEAMAYRQRKAGGYRKMPEEEVTLEMRKQIEVVQGWAATRKKGGQVKGVVVEL